MSGSAVRTAPMTWEIHWSVSASEDVTVINCNGRLVSSITEEFQAAVRPRLASGKKIVIDLTHVSHMDSSGLGTIVRLYVSARNAHCDLHVINFNKRIRELLGLTNLLGIFESCGKYMIKMP